MKLQPKNLNKVGLVAWLLYAIFEILIQLLFWIWVCIGQEIILFIGKIWLDQESNYSIFQKNITTEELIEKLDMF